jgi:hypothetical protein
MVVLPLRATTVVAPLRRTRAICPSGTLTGPYLTRSLYLNLSGGVWYLSADLADQGGVLVDTGSSVLVIDDSVSAAAQAYPRDLVGTAVVYDA